MATIKSMHQEDIYCPNFDHWLEIRLENITGEQIGLLDSTIQHKIIKHKSKSVGFMSLAEKLHVLSIAFNSRVLIVVEDEINGVSVDGFNDAIKAQGGKIKNSQLLDKLQLNAKFVLGDKQVAKSLAYMNYVQTSEIYNLIKMNNPREKSGRELRYDKKKAALNDLVEVLINFESRKRRVLEQYSLNVPKFYGLLFFYQGEKLCKEFYDKKFKHAYSKSRQDLSKAQAELCRLGYLEKRGVTRELKYLITSKGIDLLMKILSKMLYDL